MTSSNQWQSSQSHVSPGQTGGGFDAEEEKHGVEGESERPEPGDDFSKERTVVIIIGT